MVAPASRRFAWLSIAAAIATIVLKAAAWWLTDSVGLLSDALESGVNLAGATALLAVLIIAARPADDDHAFGYSKAEYFASGFEGTLILVAAVAIGITAVDRLITPRPLTQVGAGLAISVAAALINFAVARRLIAASRSYNSIALEADARHLMTDVWTSAGVIAGVAAVALTGWQRLDPLIALAVAANILWTGTRLVKRSVLGLLDQALPTEQRALLDEVLARYRARGIEFHAVRTRRAGTRSFVSLHLLVPGEWSVKAAHDLAESVESDIRAALPGSSAFTHLEPLGDPSSYDDMNLDR